MPLVIGLKSLLSQDTLICRNSSTLKILFNVHINLLDTVHGEVLELRNELAFRYWLILLHEFSVVNPIFSVYIRCCEGNKQGSVDGDSAKAQKPYLVPLGINSPYVAVIDPYWKKITIF